MARWTKSWKESRHVKDLHQRIKPLIGRRALVRLNDGSTLIGVLSTIYQKTVERGEICLFGNLEIATDPSDPHFCDYLDISDVQPA
jgi:protein involved in temperature-dependent protein secretion